MTNSFRAIAISGSSGTGKSLLVQGLSQKLGWPIFSVSAIQRENAQKFGLSSFDIHQLPDRVHQEVDQKMSEMAKTGQKVILESRLAGWLARDYSDILRVLCRCNPRVKIKRYAEREQLTLTEAKDELDKRDRENLERYQKLYQAKDYLNPKFFHLIINSAKMTPKEEVEAVLKFLEE